MQRIHSFLLSNIVLLSDSRGTEHGVQSFAQLMCSIQSSFAVNVSSKRSNLSLSSNLFKKFCQKLNFSYLPVY